MASTFSGDAYAYYLEKETKKATILCSNPECAHSGRTCNAWLNAASLCLYDGALYFQDGDRIRENGQSVDYGDRLYRVDTDGTNRVAVQALELVPGGDALATTHKEPLLHRGTSYFAYSGVLYSLPLGGDVKNARKIWGEEVQSDGSMYYDPNALHYTLWADGDTVYFMVNLEQPDGTYKDTLFAYDTAGQAVQQVWETPDAADVGNWETAGVSVSQWYVLDGFIYFYLSGGDFWRTDLETGETEKLAAVSAKTLSGSAVFSDDYLCVLNDAPHTDVGLTDPSDGTGGIGGDTFFIYDLEGNLVRKLSVSHLYDE